MIKKTFSIAHLCHYGSEGGASTLPTMLNKWLNKNTDFESTFFFNDKEHEDDYKIFLDYNRNKRNFSYHFRYNYCKSDIANFYFFMERLNKKKIDQILKNDIIHLHWVNYFLDLENILEICSKKPVVITMHDQHLLFGGCHFSSGCENFLNDCNNCPQIDEKIQKITNLNFLKKKKIFENSNVTFVHMHEKNYKIGKQILPRCNHTIIDCTANTDIFNSLSQPKILKIKNHYKIPLDKKIIIGVASYDCYTKGIWQFEELASKLNNNYFIILIGGGYQKIKNVPNKILNLGHIVSKYDIRDLYNISDIAFTLSSEEGVPGFACEALSCGTPVVGYKNVGNLDKMIINGFNGDLANIFSVDELIQKINQNYESREIIKTDFLNRFDNLFYTKYNNLYLELLKKKFNYEEIIKIYQDFKQIDLNNEKLLEKITNMNFLKKLFYRNEIFNKILLFTWRFFPSFFKNFLKKIIKRS